MHGKEQSERVNWKDGTPVSALFDDPYFSYADGLEETRYTFLAGNALPARFRDGFAIAELGFGTGLNLVASVISWEAAGISGRFSYTSFEAHPMPAPDMEMALSAFPDVASSARPLLAAWRAGRRRFAFGPADVTVIEGDARTTLADWKGRADAWYLDGFSPARNPELWGAALLSEVARHTAPGGTFATYTAAGSVRRALASAGFQVERVKGFGTKRHMSRGILRDGQ